GQDVVDVGAVARAIDLLALLVQCRGLADVVAVAFDVAVQVRHVLRDDLALRVVPGAVADAIARVDGRLAVGGRGAQIRPPRPPARARGGGQRLAVLVGTRQTAEIRA